MAVHTEEIHKQEEELIRRHHEQTRAKRIKARLEMLNTPPIYAEYTMNSFEIYDKEFEKNQRYVISTLQSYCKEFPKWLNTPRNVFLFGKVGTGKTMFAYTIAKDLINKGFTVAYFTQESLISKIRSHWPKGEDATNNYINSLIIYDLVIIDEMLRLKFSDQDLIDLSKVIESRYLHKRPFIFIGNCFIQQFEKALEARNISRLYQNKPEILSFNWSDYRLK